MSLRWSMEVPGSTKAVGSFVLCTPGWRMIIRLNVTNSTTNTTCSNNSNEAATAAAKICLVYLAELILPHPKALEFTHTETQQKKKKPDGNRDKTYRFFPAQWARRSATCNSLRPSDLAYCVPSPMRPSDCPQTPPGSEGWGA